MAARTTCVIEFDNNAQKVFYGGQLLSGRVTLTLHKEKTVRGSSSQRRKGAVVFFRTGLAKVCARVFGVGGGR